MRGRCRGKVHLSSDDAESLSIARSSTQVGVKTTGSAQGAHSSVLVKHGGNQRGVPNFIHHSVPHGNYGGHDMELGAEAATDPAIFCKNLSLLTDRRSKRRK